jgi:hypothetical protein
VSTRPDPPGYASDPPTTGAVVAGVGAGVLASVVLALVVTAVVPSGSTWGMWAAVLVPPLLGLVLLLVPRWRRVGAGFVLGLGIGAIVFAGACAGLLAWIDTQFG